MKRFKLEDGPDFARMVESPVGDWVRADEALLRSSPAASPVTVRVPDVCLTDDGAVNVEWYIDKRNLVSVSTDGKKLWAAWVNDGVTGSVGWDAADVQPKSVCDALQRLQQPAEPVRGE
jgi:hypothetical protein